MFRFVNIKTACTIACLHLLIAPTTHAQDITRDNVYVYVINDTLKMDARIDSLFDRRDIDAIESGMTASIAIHFRLIAQQNQVVSSRSLFRRLEHDIWEGQYRLIHLLSPPDTIHATDFETIRSPCAEVLSLPLLTVPFPNTQLNLQTRIEVNPITPEQQERTRRWLKILKKGSLLEFFFSFDKASQSRWVTLLSFRPQALPYLLQETPQ